MPEPLDLYALEDEYECESCARVDAIHLIGCENPVHKVQELIDELRATRQRVERAEADVAAMQANQLLARTKRAEARAERAEAERTVAWGELADQIQVAERQAWRAMEAEAAIARVEASFGSCMTDPCQWDGCPCHQVRAALRGDHA